MSTIDRGALIEQAAMTIAMNSGPMGTHYYDHATHAAAETLPVIAKALLAPLRELHSNIDPEIDWCPTCGNVSPCPTVRLLDAIEAEVSA